VAMACLDFQVPVQESEDIRMLILDGVCGEHAAVPDQSSGECPAEYDRKWRLS
jgi:hypothetical protein